MATTKDDPKLAVYAAKSREGATNLTRTAARSDAARMASKTTWDPELVGVVRAYPKTAEAFEARRERGRAAFAKLRAEGRPPNRKGVPDGWADRKQEIATVKAAAAVKAEAAVGELVAVGQLDINEWAANEALRVAFPLAIW